MEPMWPCAMQLEGSKVMCSSNALACGEQSERHSLLEAMGHVAAEARPHAHGKNRPVCHASVGH